MLISGFNLTTADYRRSRRMSLLAGGLVALLVVLLLGQLALWRHLHQATQLTQGRFEKMEAEFRRHQESLQIIREGLPDEAIKRYRTKVATYNQILEAVSFSWTGLLLELEHSVPPAVHLSEIRPDLASREVVLQGTARSFDDLGRLLRALEQRPAFHNVYLLRQAWRKSPSGGAESLDFSVRLECQGASQ